MYWGQIAVALAVSITAAYALTTAEYPLGTALATGVLVYIAVRWMLSWLFRTRFWYQTGGRNRRQCPDCGQPIWRVSGDWILRCKRCGWTAGWPGIRWVTQSVPARQLYRTVVGPELVVVVIVGALLVTGIAGSITLPGIQASLAAADGNYTNTTATGNGVLAETTSPEDQGDTDSNVDDELNTTEVERLVWQYTNEIRTERGLSQVDYAPRIAEAARDHAHNMAQHDYIGHTQPNGQTGEERYQDLCDYEGSGYLFGENAGGTWYKQNILDWETNRTVYLENESEVARYLVTGWLMSEGHRENMLNPEWTEMGVGAAVRDDGKVFAAQTFC